MEAARVFDALIRLLDPDSSGTSKAVMASALTFMATDYISAFPEMLEKVCYVVMRTCINFCVYEKTGGWICLFA